MHLLDFVCTLTFFAPCLSTTLTRNLEYGKCHAISRKTVPPWLVDAWPHSERIGVKCLSQGLNDLLPSSGMTRNLTRKSVPG